MYVFGGGVAFLNEHVILEEQSTGRRVRSEKGRRPTRYGDIRDEKRKEGVYIRQCQVIIYYTDSHPSTKVLNNTYTPPPPYRNNNRIISLSPLLDAI
jgi:hypothetical protein